MGLDTQSPASSSIPRASCFCLSLRLSGSHFLPCDKDHCNVLVPNILLPCQLLQTWSSAVLTSLGRLTNTQGEKTCLGIMRSSCIQSCLASQSLLGASMLWQFQRSPTQLHELAVPPQNPGTILFLSLRAIQGTGAGNQSRCGSSSAIRW